MTQEAVVIHSFFAPTSAVYLSSSILLTSVGVTLRSSLRCLLPRRNWNSSGHSLAMILIFPEISSRFMNFCWECSVRWTSWQTSAYGMTCLEFNMYCWARIEWIWHIRLIPFDAALSYFFSFCFFCCSSWANLFCCTNLSVSTEMPVFEERLRRLWLTAAVAYFSKPIGFLSAIGAAPRVSLPKSSALAVIESSASFSFKNCSIDCDLWDIWWAGMLLSWASGISCPSASNGS